MNQPLLIFFSPLLLLTLIAGCAPTSPTCIDPAKVIPDAMCTMQYDPVCGCDGKTYSNECVATNAGVTSFKEGECLEAVQK